MAIPLNHYAVRCEKAAIANGTMNPSTSYRVSLYDVSRNWRRQINATSFRSVENDEYSERHIAGADVIIDQLLCLHRDGCENIERLLRSRIHQRFGIL